MPNSAVKIALSTGSEAVPVAEFVERAAEPNLPRLTWGEPELTAVSFSNTGGRLEGFVPLVRGKPDWGDVPIAEARLFWSGAVLHVVSIEGGCRWFRCEEDTGESVVERRAYLVHLHSERDRCRFGILSPAEGFGKLWVVEYHRSGRMVAWRLAEGIEQ